MLKFYGTGICSGCTEAKTVLEQLGIQVEYIDITENIFNLREFLALRDSREEFDEMRKEGRVGLPLFLWDDGTIEIGTDWLEKTHSCKDC